MKDQWRSIAGGLPRDTSRFYSYEGSLTTPGCDENVRWIIFKEIQEISAEQVGGRSRTCAGFKVGWSTASLLRGEVAGAL